jgi:hypothetical protein
MTTDRLGAGSRMHVLDWLDCGTFITSINRMLRPTGFLVPQSGNRMPRGWHDPREARLGKDCEALIHDDINTILINWWLTKVTAANVPNWDLACEARASGSRIGLVLVEAKAHEAEFLEGRLPKNEGKSENHERISAAIEEARRDLSRHAQGVNISSAHWYQFSNRVAFAWKLASEGIPTVLIYLGFTGDGGMKYRSTPFRDHGRQPQAGLIVC